MVDHVLRTSTSLPLNNHEYASLCHSCIINYPLDLELVFYNLAMFKIDSGLTKRTINMAPAKLQAKAGIYLSDKEFSCHFCDNLSANTA